MESLEIPGYDSILRKREQRWNQLFEQFSKPSDAPGFSLPLDQLENGEESACVQNAMHQEVDVSQKKGSRAKLSKRLFSPNRSNIVRRSITGCVDNNKLHAEESLSTCFAVTEIDNADLTKKKRSRDSVDSLDVSEESCQKTVKYTRIDNSKEVYKTYFSSTQSDEGFACAELKVNIFRCLKLELILSGKKNRTGKHDGVSKKAKETSRVGSSVERVENANVPESSEALTLGSKDEYLRYIDECHEHEENPDAIIAKIKSMTRYTRGEYKMAKFVLRFLKSSGQQNTAVYASARESRDEQLRIMRKKFNSYDISLYDKYLDWLYDKRRKF